MPTESSNVGIGPSTAEPAPPAQPDTAAGEQVSSRPEEGVKATGKPATAWGRAPAKGAQAAGEAKAEAEAATVAQAAPAPTASASAPPPQPAAQEQPKPELGTLVVRNRNAVGSSVRLVKVTYLLDGKVITTQSGDRVSAAQEVEAAKRNVEATNHVLTAVAEYEGTGYGVFSYHDGYRYTAQSSYRFTTHEKTTTVVTVNMFEKGGVTTAMSSRLAISFRVSASGA